MITKIFGFALLVWSIFIFIGFFLPEKPYKSEYKKHLIISDILLFLLGIIYILI